MKMNLSLDEVVGLVLEFAEVYHVNIKIVKDINDKYDTGNPSDEEKIQLLRTVLPLLPATSYLTDIVKKYLVAVDAGEIEETNAKVEKIDDYLLEDGGLVTTYRVESVATSTFFIATFDDGDDEVVWGVGDNSIEALENAEREWKRLNPDVEENPFTEALKQI